VAASLDRALPLLLPLAGLSLWQLCAALRLVPDYLLARRGQGRR
jgi:ABC-type nitrate/sulfonate/bicarbonate transport system permease component